MYAKLIVLFLISSYCNAATNPISESANKAIKKTNTVKEQQKSEPTILTNIKALIQKQQFDQAKTLATNYLKSTPNDVDVILFLGIIYYRQADYQQAEQSFQLVLQKTPNYLDAKIGLARVMLVEKKYKEASNLITSLVKEAPNNPEVQEIQKSYQRATSVQTPPKKHLKKSKVLHKTHKISKKIKKKPNAIDVELSKNTTRALNKAMRMINAGLMSHPADKKLLTQKAEAYYRLHQYSLSAQSAQKALALDPTYGPTKAMLSSISEISPNKLWGRNEVGIFTWNEYVTDLHQNWDYSQVHLSRDTAIGTLSARLNYANRQNIGGYQGEFELYPIINPYVYLDLYFGFADQPALFPKDAFAAEGYAYFPTFATFSLGEYYAHILGAINYKKTTGSISKDIGHNTLTFRVNHYVPNRGKDSTLYLATLYHYFNNYDFSLSLTGGYGTSPDLYDLLTTDFITIQNRFININLRFPVFHNRLLVDLGADYQNWRYPSGLDRQLIGGKVGLNYRF